MSSTHIHILTTAPFPIVGPDINIGVIVGPVLGASRRPARSRWATTTVLLSLVAEETDTCGRSSSSRARQAGKEEDRGAAGGEVGEIRIAPPSQSVRAVSVSAGAGCVAGLEQGGGTG